MASTQHVLLSPAELAFLQTSLSQSPPIRADGRSPTQFRPLSAETGMLPGTNGSARVCFADGTEAIVGVKAEVEKTGRRRGGEEEEEEGDDEEDNVDNDDDDNDGDGERSASRSAGASSWVEVTVEIPGVRDDESSTVFLAALLAEAMLVDGNLTRALRINRRFHWKLFLDILLISPPLSYPLPLLSLTSHLALLATRLPRLISEGDEDPYFDDDWEASTFLYPQTKPDAPTSGPSSSSSPLPPITLLVMMVGDNVLFDPTGEELAVANAVLAVSVGTSPSSSSSSTSSSSAASSPSPPLRLLAIRTIDPPSRLTAPGVPYNAEKTQQQSTAGTTRDSTAGASTDKTAPSRVLETEPVYGVWRAPRGGTRVGLLAAMTQRVLEKGGVAEEVFAGLRAVEVV